MGRFDDAIPWAAPHHVPEALSYADPAIRAGGEFLYVDCGVWAGDDRSSPARRCFVVVCGRSVVLCEFRVGDPFEDLTGGPEPERTRLNRALRCIAGRQRLDVQVVRFMRAESEAPASEDPPLYVFLPEAQLPLATKTRDLDADLIPDPRAATCLCCGPILQRIMYGEQIESEYRAYGCNLGRDPNGWFLGMTENFYDAADDLITFFGRLTKLRRTEPLHLVQLGELFEVWAGYACCFQASGRSAIVIPQVVRAGMRELTERWRDVAVNNSIRRALDVVTRFSPSSRTMFDTDTPLFEQPNVFWAERPPAVVDDEQPMGMFELLVQNALFLPWRRCLDPAGRESALRVAVERWSARADTGAPFPIYVTAHSQIPCLTKIRINPLEVPCRSSSSTVPNSRATRAQPPPP